MGLMDGPLAGDSLQNMGISLFMGTPIFTPKMMF